jgi:hypothetical protein
MPLLAGQLGVEFFDEKLNLLCMTWLVDHGELPRSISSCPCYMPYSFLCMEGLFFTLQSAVLKVVVLPVWRQAAMLPVICLNCFYIISSFLYYWYITWTPHSTAMKAIWPDYISHALPFEGGLRTACWEKNLIKYSNRKPKLKLSHWIPYIFDRYKVHPANFG